MDDRNNIKEVIVELQKAQLEIATQPNTYEELLAILSAHINHIITNSFSRLISILYRLDISEKKLKQLLSNQQNVDAGQIIAAMIVERQLQKIETRKRFGSPPPSISEDEKW